MAIPEQGDWLTEQNPDTLLRVVIERADYGRRLRLFECACARQVWHLLPTDAQSAVQASERFAERKASSIDVRAAAVRLPGVAITPAQMAITAAGHASAAVTLYPYHGQAARYAARALATEAVGPVPLGPSATESWHDTWNAVYSAARAVQADYVRDIFPPPGLAPQLDPDWLTSTVVALARHMDESGDFSAVPILADALQDAGCDTDPVLQCCRAPANVHVRGNWVVDLVLGR